MLLYQGRSQEAMTVLERVERQEPDNPWLWYYRGTAHLQLSSPYKAMECYDRAADILASLGDPDPDLADRIRRQRAQARRHVFGLSGHVGLAYDTNVSFLGDAGTLDILAGRPDGKFASGFQVDFAPVADERNVIAAGVRFGHSWHFSVTEFDYQDYGEYLRYVRRLGESWEAEVLYDYDVNCLGRDGFLSNHAVTPSVTYRWRSADAAFRPRDTRVYYRFEAQDFLFATEPEYDRDGFAHGVGVEQRFLFRPVAGRNWVWEISAGYGFASFATEGTQYDRFTHDFQIGMGVPLVNPVDPDKYLILPDKELIFRFNADWQIEDYWNRNLEDRDRDGRSDLLTTYSFVVSQTLMSEPDRGDLVLHAIIHWTDAESNVTTRDALSPFTYDKVIYGIQLAWSW